MALSKFPLQYLVISIRISSKIIIQLPFSFYFYFSAERKGAFFVSGSAENDIVFFGRFYFLAENKNIIFGHPLLYVFVRRFSLLHIAGQPPDA